jgi:hypothetical protein
VDDRAARQERGVAAKVCIAAVQHTLSSKDERKAMDWRPHDDKIATRERRDAAGWVHGHGNLARPRREGVV